MMKNPRNLLWMVPLATILSSPLWQSYVADFLTPRGGYDAKAAQASKDQTQNFTMDGVEITLSSSGLVTWQINAQRAFTGDTDQEVRMVEVDALYTGKGDNDNRITITSNRGSYHLDSQHLILRENVVIIKPAKNEEMYTDLLHYYDSTKMLISPVDVDIKGPKFDLQAGRMDYDLSIDAYDFNDRVRVTL